MNGGGAEGFVAGGRGRVATAMLDELNAAMGRMDGRQEQWLDRAGAGKIARIRGGGVGVARVRPYADGTYEPDPDGGEVNAVIQGVWTGLFFSGMAPSVGVSTGPALIDLVAWSPHDPTSWCTRRGVASSLGSDAYHRWDIEAPVRLCATPLSWLRALGDDPFGDQPTVILDPVAGMTPSGRLGARAAVSAAPEYRRYLRDILHGASAVICDDDAHAAGVHKALQLRPKPPGLPEVRVAA